MMITSIFGELYLYDTSVIADSDSLGSIFDVKLGKLIITAQFYENFMIVAHPDCVKTYEIIANDEVDIKLVKSIDCKSMVQMIKVNEDLNILIVASSSGLLTIFNLPDLILLDTMQLEDCKIQTFDNYRNYLVVATNMGTQILDVSSKSLHVLKEIESGFMYPVTINLKILSLDSSTVNELPQALTFAQTGLEGKVSVITVRIESQTEPTVTINTAAQSAPVSNSCTNPSGLIINQPESRFIFRAHRTTLSDKSVLIGPVYSLAVVDGYLVTCGYGGNQKNVVNSSVEGSICFWDTEKKKRLKMFKGFPQSIVNAASWVTSGNQNILVCGCSDDSFKNMTPEMASQYPVRASTATVVVLQP